MPQPTLIVNAGPHRREQCPVEASIPAPSDAVASVRLKDEETGQQLQGQILGVSEGQARIAWIIPELAAGSTRRYRVDFSEEPAPSSVTLKKSDGRVDIFLGAQLFTSYCFSKDIARPCFFPVIGPTGAKMTRNFPMAKGPEGETTDHKHHRSIWVSHGDVNGVDNWSEEKDHGRTVHRALDSVLSGEVRGQIVAESDWVSAKGEKVLSERLAVCIYSLAYPCRIMDFDITFRSDQDVVFGDTKEGGILSIRVATSMDGNKGGLIRNSYGGTTEAETWGKRAHWCDYTGPVEGKTAGFTIMDHPGNFRHPTYWHVRDYGLFTANPFGLSHFHGDKSRDGSHKVPAGVDFRFRYRLVIHAGGPDEAGIAEKYHDFINPPKIAQE